MKTNAHLSLPYAREVNMDAIRSALKDLDSNTLFNSDTSKLKEACKDYLINQGYSVMDPVKRMYKVTRLFHLTELLYSLLKRDHPDIGKSRCLYRDFVSA